MNTRGLADSTSTAASVPGRSNRLVTSEWRADSHRITVASPARQIVDNVRCQHYREVMTTAIDSRGPLGPDSLTWKYFGDLRTGMLGVWIGAIQNMYPELGAGVEDHSILLREPLQRVARSVYPIMGVVYDGDRAAQTGEQIKGFHTTIKGVDAEGRRYHALNPEMFYWAHATFFMLIIKTAEYFCGGLTEAEKRQLFDEHVQWYRMYGKHAAGAQVVGGFCEYWDRKCSDELEINRATLDIFSIRIPKPWFVLMPTPVWNQIFRPMVGATLDRGRALRSRSARKSRHVLDARR